MRLDWFNIADKNGTETLTNSSEINISHDSFYKLIKIVQTSSIKNFWYHKLSPLDWLQFYPLNLIISWVH